MSYNRSTVAGHGDFIEQPSQKLKQTLHLYHNTNMTKSSSTAKPFHISYDEADKFYG